MTCRDSSRECEPDDGATSSLLPHRDPVSLPPRGTRRLRLGDDETAVVFDALATDCTVAILRALFVEPMTTGDVADTVETSVQNASYHLQKLEDAGLIEVVDTWYSSRGLEMAVYAPPADRVVVDLGATTTRDEA